MPNPFLPLWEYIPDGEPRVFGDRVYIYGSHDRPGSIEFCDYKLKVWSAPIDNLNNWTCHGHIFHTKDDRDHKSDTDWTDNNLLFAPDVVEKDGKYYLYAYIMGTKGCVAVSDKPEGPFTLISKYKYNENEGNDSFKGGWFIDPGTLVDDDGKVYVFCGFQGSFGAEINADNMYEVIDGSFKDNVIPKETESGFFEACSPRKIGDTYYMIYSPAKGSRLAYATSKTPMGPYEFRGNIVDNEIDYPGGNDHGSICCINGQWYIFYHKMTNGTIMSRRACVEKIEILSDGTIPQVEMTSLGFEDSLLPYRITPAEIACVLKGGCLITELNIFTRVITNITEGCIIGYKYFDFGEDYSTKTMKFAAETIGRGCDSQVHILIDSYENGEEIGVLNVGRSGGTVTAVVKNVTGRHALYFKVTTDYGDDWIGQQLKGRQLFDLKSFVFMK